MMVVIPDVFVNIKVYRFLQLQHGNVVFNDSKSLLLLVTVVRGVAKVFHRRAELKSFPAGHIVFTWRQDVQPFLKYNLHNYYHFRNGESQENSGISTPSVIEDTD